MLLWRYFSGVFGNEISKNQAEQIALQNACGPRAVCARASEERPKAPDEEGIQRLKTAWGARLQGQLHRNFQPAQHLQALNSPVPTAAWP